MKTVFIKIDNISEINTSKITVRDLNNRYIDKEGKMYGLKYNRKTRKVNIIRIMRTPVKSVEYYNQMLRAHRKGEKYSYNPEPKTEIVEQESPETKEETGIDFNIEVFINNVVELMQTHKQRLAGIMMNIKNSHVVSDEHRGDSAQLNDLFRNLEIDGILRIEKVLTSLKEIKQYPRSITYYIAKLDTAGRNILEELDTDSRKMAYIYASEMFNSINGLYRTLLKILKDIHNFSNKLNPEESKDTTSMEKQSFHDALTTIENTISEIEKLLVDLKKYEFYIRNPDNF